MKCPNCRSFHINFDTTSNDQTIMKCSDCLQMYNIPNKENSKITKETNGENET